MIGMLRGTIVAIFIMNDPAASSGVSSSLLGRQSVLDTESSRAFWIPAFAGMTNSRQAAGNGPQAIQSGWLPARLWVCRNGTKGMSAMPGIEARKLIPKK
jgi:hypothetical protein